jgi:hypothetical protein
VARAAVEIAEVPEVLSFFEMAFDQTLVTPSPSGYRIPIAFSSGSGGPLLPHPTTALS